MHLLLLELLKLLLRISNSVWLTKIAPLQETTTTLQLPCERKFLLGVTKLKEPQSIPTQGPYILAPPQKRYEPKDTI